MAGVSSCREVSCQVRQRARPAFLFANVSERTSEHNRKTAPETERKVQATPGLYGPNLWGNTRATMVGTMGCNTERWSETSKPDLSSD